MNDPTSSDGHGINPWMAVVLGGMVAGTVDIGAACLINGKGIGYILQAIAGGVLAERSFTGGAATQWLGLVLQEFMGILIAAIYVGASRVSPWLARRWVAAGLAYGVPIYFVMNYVVLPLSAWHHAPAFKLRSFLLNMAAMLLFGVIVAYFSSRARAASSSPHAAMAVTS